MSKWKERINKILKTEHDRIEGKLIEAEGNYRDTGYQKYYTQIERLENELNEIDNFLNAKLNLAQADSECRRYREAITLFRRKMDDYKLYHKGMDRPVDETVDALATRLDTALGERRLS